LLAQSTSVSRMVSQQTEILTATALSDPNIMELVGVYLKYHPHDSV